MTEVFVGPHVLILPAATIGSGSVVGAGAVVTQDVPENTVVAGMPARPVKSVNEYALATRDEWIDTARTG